MSAPIVGELRAVAPGLLTDEMTVGLMLLVTHVADGYVLAVPVTTTDVLTGVPALIVGAPDGEPLAVWPRAETGLDTSALGHHITMLLDPSVVPLMRRYAEDGAPAPFATSSRSHDAAGVHRLILTMQALCFYQPVRT